MGYRKGDILKLYNDPRLINAIPKFNLFEFLSEYNVDYSMEGKNIGKDFVGVNPCPNSGCNDNKRHFGIHVEQKYGTCFKCKAYAGILKIVSYFGHMSISDAFNYIIQFADDIDINKDNVDKVKEILFGKSQPLIYTPDKKDTLPEGNKKITLNELQKNKLLKQFFIKRRLSLLDIKKYDLRFIKNEIIFPIYLNNKIVSYQKRYINRKQYYNPKNLLHYIYNEHKIIINKPLILVEGFFDCIRIDKFINKYFNLRASVTTGFVKAISEHQLQRISSCRASEIIVAYDNDSWFDYMRIKKLVPFDVNFIILPKGKDPDSLTEKELITIFKKEIKL